MKDLELLQKSVIQCLIHTFRKFESRHFRNAITSTIINRFRLIMNCI